jgi:hypothetical protein
MQDGCERSRWCRCRVNVFSPDRELCTSGVAGCASAMMISHSSRPAFGIEKVSKHGDFVAVQRDVQKPLRTACCDVHRTARYGHRLVLRAAPPRPRAKIILCIKISQLRVNSSKVDVCRPGQDRPLPANPSQFVPSRVRRLHKQGRRPSRACIMRAASTVRRHTSGKECRVSQAYTGISNIELSLRPGVNPNGVIPVF